MKKSIILLAFVAVIVSSGCIDMLMYPTIDAESLMESPEEHYMEEHVIIARPLTSDTDPIFNHLITDGESSLPLNFTGFNCDECMISGLVDKVIVCDCYGASCSSEGCVPGEEAWKYVDRRPAAACEGRTFDMVLGNLLVKNFLRCGPGTEEEIYYFQVFNATSVRE